MDTYAEMLSDLVKTAAKAVGTQKELAARLKYKTPSSLRSSVFPGGISVEKILLLARLGELADSERTDLLYAHVCWRLSKMPEGRAMLPVVREAEKNVPKDRIEAFRAKVVAAFLAEVKSS